MGRQRAGARRAPFGTRIGVRVLGELWGLLGCGARSWAQRAPWAPSSSGGFMVQAGKEGRSQRARGFPKDGDFLGTFCSFSCPGALRGSLRATPQQGPARAFVLPGAGAGRLGAGPGAFERLSPPFASNTAPAIKTLKIFPLAGHLEASPFSLPSAWARSWLLSGAVGGAGRAAGRGVQLSSQAHKNCSPCLEILFRVLLWLKEMDNAPRGSAGCPHVMGRSAFSSPDLPASSPSASA